MNDSHAAKRTALVGPRGSIRDALSPDALIRRLLDEAERQELTPQQFADRTGLPYSAAHKLLRGASRRPTLEGAMALASALGVTVELFDGYGRKVR